MLSADSKGASDSVLQSSDNGSDKSVSDLPDYSKTRIKMITSQNIGSIPLWELCTGQLGVLRKIAQGKLSAIEASDCASNSQFKM